MTTINIAPIILAAIAGIIMLLIYINKRNRERRNKELMFAFSAARHSGELRLLKEEVLRDKIIGLDGLQRKLFVFDFLKNREVKSIRLADVSECVLEKKYQNISFGNDKKAGMEKTLCTMGIKFMFKNEAEMFFISFYDSMLHSIYEMKELEEKAKKWETLISKLLLKKTNVNH